jgi:hypothetical protein
MTPICAWRCGSRGSPAIIVQLCDGSIPGTFDRLKMRATFDRSEANNVTMRARCSVRPALFLRAQNYTDGSRFRLITRHKLPVRRNDAALNSGPSDQSNLYYQMLSVNALPVLRVACDWHPRYLRN